MPSEAILAIKQTIIERSIAEDQHAVALMWLKTFTHNDENNLACNMAKLLLAAVAVGDFKTVPSKIAESFVSEGELGAPNSVLTACDYLSHASRIIIDYRQLSPKNQQSLLAYFPKPAINQKIVSRSATHAVTREAKGIKEHKGFLLGLAGQLPTMINTPLDFGVNIAMGGNEQVNYIDNQISENGFSGHMYFHLYEPHFLLMAGLEQSAPSSSLYEAIAGHAHEDGAEVQASTDQFGQGHSLVGASDVFTAAGSMYFSDSMYQAKLISEKRALPPKKYGGMQVKLNDENWQGIVEFITDINKLISKGEDGEIIALLKLKPQSARKEEQPLTNYIALDFKNYLKRAALLLGEADKQPDIENLLTQINSMKAGQLAPYPLFIKSIDSILSNKQLPASYKSAINRIKVLFEYQLEIDPNLKAAHDKLLKKPSKMDNKQIFRNWPDVDAAKIPVQYEHVAHKPPSASPDEVKVADEDADAQTKISALAEENKQLRMALAATQAELTMASESVKELESQLNMQKGASPSSQLSFFQAVVDNGGMLAQNIAGYLTSNSAKP